MKNKTVLSSALFLGADLLLLALAVLMGPIYSYFQALVAAHYTYLYYHLFSLVLILFAVLAVAVSKLRFAGRWKAGVCAATAGIALILYILVFTRLMGISVFGRVGSLFASRHSLALLTAFELAVAVAALWEKKADS